MIASLILIALVLVAWWARPIRYIDIEITAQPAGSQFFLVETKMILPGLEGPQVSAIATNLVHANQMQRVAMPKNVGIPFGELSVVIYHPEYRYTGQSYKHYQGQAFRLQALSWESVLAQQPEVEINSIPLDKITTAYLEKEKSGKILKLEAAHFHLWKIVEYYVQAVKKQEGTHNMRGSLVILQRLAQAVERGSEAQDLNDYHRELLEKIESDLALIEERLQ